MSHRWLSLLIISLGLAASAFVPVRAEYFSSVDSMQMLGTLEKGMLEATRSYLTAQNEQLQIIRNFVERVRLEQRAALKDLGDYVGHPLQAFLLLKRVVKEWAMLHDMLMYDKPREVFQQKLDNLTADFRYPDQAELQGAVQGLARLQNIYNLKASDLADGNFNGQLLGDELNWFDCYPIAVQLFELGQYKRAVEWFLVTANLLIPMPEDETKKKFMSELHEYLAMANLELGHKDLAIETLNYTLNANTNPPAVSTQFYIEHSKERKPINETQATWYANYTSLCQGKHLPENRTAKLSCFLDTKRHAIFRLAPLKVEQVHLDPDIHIYHELLNDDQIDSIFVEADKLEMIRSSVVSSTGGSTVMDVRVSQQIWLDYSSPVMRMVKQVVAAISGFDMAGSEIMQVANYGVGGQYEPHPDYFKNTMPDSFEGDRISTSMLYLSEVLQGGYTVFPKLNVFLPPIKGAMVMWHNLLYSLTPDTRTLHAGCPVILGSKRIGNIWTHSGHQVFLRPCKFNDDSYKAEE